MKTYKFDFSVAYADTDAGGIMYHGRYIEIAERARMNMMRGISVPDGDLGFVVKKLDIKYMSPLKLADDFIVETAITAVGAVSMDLEQKFVHGDTICAIMHITVAYIGADMKLKSIPGDITSRLN
ncbi:MAG: thioesterase family protein [Alphaproteobacteria bacterium]|nr:thioesterase family protein [Alphaproteobacteria bacterium]